MHLGRAAGSQAGSKGTKGKNRPESHTIVAHCVTWEPMGRLVLHAPARHSAQARSLSNPLGSAIFSPTGVALHDPLWTLRLHRPIRPVKLRWSLLRYDLASHSSGCRYVSPIISATGNKKPQFPPRDGVQRIQYRDQTWA